MTSKKIIIIILSIVLLVVGVLSFHWMDVANTKFWWTAWPWIGGISLAAFIALSLYFWTQEPKRKKP